MFAQVWVNIFKLFGEDAFYMDIIGSNLVSSGVFWLLCAMLSIVDLTGRPEWVTRYKTQPGKNQPVEPLKLWNAVKVALFNQTLISLPISVLVYWIKIKIGAPYKPEHLPSTLLVLRDLAVFVIVEEIGFYYTHRLVHWGPLYKAIHKKHHEWTAPVGVVAVYAHPFEYILSNVMPFVMGPLIMRSHMATTWLWYALAVTTTVCHHSGYHLPLMPSPEFHDFHHLKFTGNYGVLGWLDYLHGTDDQFRNSVQSRRDHLSLGLTPVNHLYPSSEK